jgi:hypothetical protein
MERRRSCPSWIATTIAKTAPVARWKIASLTLSGKVKTYAGCSSNSAQMPVVKSAAAT